MNPVKVTCAIIIIEGKVLAVQRSATMRLPLKWEFPGGKIEELESAEDCIKREISEELGIEIGIEQKLTPSIFEYPTVTVELIPFVASICEGEITLKEHAQYLLLDKGQLSELDWAEADLPILKEFLSL